MDSLIVLVQIPLTFACNIYGATHFIYRKHATLHKVGKLKEILCCEGVQKHIFSHILP